MNPPQLSLLAVDELPVFSLFYCEEQDARESRIVELVRVGTTYLRQVDGRF